MNESEIEKQEAPNNQALTPIIEIASPQNLTPSQAEILEFINYSRYTAIATDRLMGTLMQMTSKLEEEGFLISKRPSKINRDKKLQKYCKCIQKSDEEINEMMKAIPNHPEAEELVRSLFGGFKTFNFENKETNLDNNNINDISSNNNINDISSNNNINDISSNNNINDNLENIPCDNSENNNKTENAQDPSLTAQNVK